ncbi:hypothetical protein H5410_040041 [Solanum commersonii]|uniref:Uncharacterized protein n=1 Tax=Solanum commersonii TaxID=4109 RepID=A0A9J5XPU7_SOLCO|nr:hypothetical protein H5410_040041 [Solanum commersonii]
MTSEFKALKIGSSLVFVAVYVDEIVLTGTDVEETTSLKESTLPFSLSELIIQYYHNLQSLPVKGMLSSLTKLSISNCALLKPRLDFDKGEYWPKIAHISTIEIEEEHL